MAGLMNLCMDQVTETSNVTADNPVLSDSLQSLLHHSVFKNTEDENLKLFFKFINQQLNDPKSRAKGLMLLDNFLSQLDSSRFIVIQDSFVSALNLLAKCLDLDLSHRILVYLIPMSHKLPELSQAVVSTILPKLMTRFIENNKNSSTFPSTEEICAVLTCVEKFRGPCGSYRMQLEKVLLPYIDQDAPDFPLISKVFPRLSATSGGGNKGDKYSLDWNQCIMKYLAVSHDTLIELYSNTSSLITTENPYEFEGAGLEIPAMRPTKDILLKFSLLSRRLCNLARIVGAYLEEPFPAPKLVPLRGILNLIGNMVSLNPVNLMRNPAQEIQHLAGLIPTIQEVALELLDKLILSCGSQIFSEAARIEFQILQQFKWMSSVPHSFDSLRKAAYGTLQHYLEVTKGSMTAALNSSTLVEYIFQDIRIEKHSVSLSLGTKTGKKSGKRARQSDHGITATSLALQGGDKQVNVKNDTLCLAALKTLKLLIPSLAFDAASYRATYLLVATTTADFLESAEHPSPYDSPECRLHAFECLLQLALFPNHSSPISVGLIINLLELGSEDRNVAVGYHCGKILGILERVIHPSCGTLDFPPVIAKLPAPSRSKLFADGNRDQTITNNGSSPGSDFEDEDVVDDNRNGNDGNSGAEILDGGGDNDNDDDDSDEISIGSLTLNDNTQNGPENEMPGKYVRVSSPSTSTPKSAVNSRETSANLIDISLLKESVAPMIQESVAAVLKEHLGTLSFNLSEHLQKLYGQSQGQGQRRGHSDDYFDDPARKRQRPESEYAESVETPSATLRNPPAEFNFKIPADASASSKAQPLSLPSGEDGFGFTNLMKGKDPPAEVADTLKERNLDYLPKLSSSVNFDDDNNPVVTIEDMLLTFDGEIIVNEPQEFRLKDTKSFNVSFDPKNEEGIFNISEAGPDAELILSMGTKYTEPEEQEIIEQVDLTTDDINTPKTSPIVIEKEVEAIKPAGAGAADADDGSNKAETEKPMEA